MSPAPRVLVVSRRYWPHCADSSWRLMSWVSQLSRGGAKVTILSATWHKDWTQRIECREVPVFRIEHAPTNPLRTARYSRALSEWVISRLNDFDLIYCDAAELEAQVLLSQVPSLNRPPVVVRFDPLELSDGSDLNWHPNIRTEDACRRASLIIAPRADAHQRLKSMGIDESKIYRMLDIPDVIERADLSRAAARNALADINHDLFVRGTDRVLIFAGELTRNWGAELLIRAVGPLLYDHRSLRVWLLGDSSERSRLYEILRYQGWHNLITMPGCFEDMSEVMKVADLCVVPARGKGLSWILPTCLASGIPILTAEGSIPSLRGFLPQELESQQLTFRDGDVESLRMRIKDWLAGSKSLLQTAAVVRQKLATQSAFSFEALLARCNLTVSS